MLRLEEESNPIKELLNSRAFQRLRFGGIIGKLALLGISGAVIVVGVGVRSSNASVQSLCVVGGLVFLCLVIGGILSFGFKYPVHATLEGTEIVQVEHMQQQIRAKGISAPKDSAQVLEGLGTPPAREPLLEEAGSRPLGTRGEG